MIMPPKKPSKELLRACTFLGLRQENRFLFIYKGHEIDLSGCVGDTPIHVLNCVAEQLAERITNGFNEHVKSLFTDVNKQDIQF